MKNTRLFYLCLLFLISTASAAGPKYRDFLVQKQPMPDGLLHKQDFVSSDVNIKYKNSNSDDVTIGHKKTWLDMSPIFITNKSSSFSVFGLGYMRDDFGSLDSSHLSSYYSGVYASLYAISEINNNWYWNSYFSYGIFSENNINSSNKSDKIVTFVNLAYKKNTKQVYKLGVLYNSNFGEDVILPTLGVSYSYQSYVFDALIPAYVSLRKIHSRKFHCILKAEFSYASYYDHNQNDILEIAGVEVGVSVEYNIYSYVWLQAGASYIGEKELTWLKADDNFASIGNGYKFTGGFNVRF